MFVPKIYRNEDFEFAHQIIQEHPLGQLISYKKQLFSTHSIFTIKGNNEAFHLETHISKANRQGSFLENNDEVLCSFLGVNAYISSSWYEKINVSTYNYQAVQIAGTIIKMTENQLYQHLKEITHSHEQSQKCPMTFDKMGEKFIENEMKGAVGYIIHPTKMDAANKLSQNRNNLDYSKIITNLELQNNTKSQEMAKCMKNEMIKKSI